MDSYLKKGRYNSYILFIPQWIKETQNGFRKMMAFIEKIKPKIIGISVMSYQFQKVSYLTKKIKTEFPEIFVIWGGIHPTIAPDECIQIADAICLGEGEEAILELIQKIDKGEEYKDIKNFWFIDKGRIIKNDIRPYIKDLDQIPYPDYEFNNWYVVDDGEILKVNTELYCKYMHWGGRAYDIITTRGCPYSCAFCCNSTFKKIYHRNYVRRRSVINVIQEIENALNKFNFINLIDIQDDNFFSAPIEWIEEFSSLYNKKIKLPFYARAHPKAVTEEKVKLLKTAGLAHIQMGLQADEKINKELFNRKVSNKEFILATKIFNKHRIIQHYDVILNNPWAQDEDLIKLLQVLLLIEKPYFINIFYLVFYFGTPLYEKAKKENKLTEKNVGYNSYFVPPEHYNFLEDLIIHVENTPNFLIRFFIKYREFTLARRFFSLYKFLITLYKRITAKFLSRPDLHPVIRRIYLVLRPILKISKI